MGDLPSQKIQKGHRISSVYLSIEKLSQNPLPPPLLSDFSELAPPLLVCPVCLDDKNHFAFKNAEQSLSIQNLFAVSLTSETPLQLVAHLACLNHSTEYPVL